MIIYDNTIWSYKMMIIYNDKIRYNAWWSHTIITYDHRIWWSSMIIIIYVIWGHLGVIWETFGSHLRAFGIHLETSGRVEAEEARSHIMCLALQRNAKVPLKCQFHEGVLRVPSIMTAFLQSDMVGGFSTATPYRSRALYQHRENPISKR